MSKSGRKPLNLPIKSPTSLPAPPGSTAARTSGGTQSLARPPAVESPFGRSHPSLSSLASPASGRSKEKSGSSASSSSFSAQGAIPEMAPTPPLKQDPIASLVPDLADLRHFLTDNPEAFQVNLFIQKLMKPCLESDACGKFGLPARGTEFGFDPSALHEVFTATIERLNKLGKEVDERVVGMQEDANRFAAHRKKELERHHRSLHEVHVTIEDIETHFRKVGLTAVRIGQSLSQTEFQRQKAEHAQQLLEFFLAFESVRPDMLARDSESERIELLSNETLACLADEQDYKVAAEILADLNVICEDLNAPHLDNAVRAIRVFSDRLEKRLLRRFEAAAMGPEGPQNTPFTPNVAVMKDCAACLLKFGDPVKVYNTYIYSIVSKQIQTVRRNEAGQDADEMRDALSEYFGLVSSLCERAFTLIRQVFPPSAALKVTRMLIDRMVNDPAFGIQVKVTEMLKAEGTEDTLSVSDSLDMLLMVHDKTQALATALIDHCVQAEHTYHQHHIGGGRRLDSMGDFNDDHFDAEGQYDDDDAAQDNGPTTRKHLNSSAPTASSRSQEALSTYVKTLFAELFVGQRGSYLEKEVWLLRLRLIDGVQAVCGDVGLTSMEKKPKKLFENRASKQIATAFDLPTLVINKVCFRAFQHSVYLRRCLIQGQVMMLMWQIDTYDLMLQRWLRKEVLSVFLESTREAISRNAKMFRKDDERADNVLEILALLHQFLPTTVLLPTLSAASNIVQNPQTWAPPPNFWKVLAAVHEWISMFKEFFRSTALPEVQTKTTTQTVLLESCRKFLGRVERAGAKTIELGLDAIIRTVERMHREYLVKTDYLPREDTVAELQGTKACLAVRELLTQQTEMMSSYLPEKDVREIVTALAVKSQELLLDRIKQVKISTAGALVLMQDVELIYGCFSGTESPDIKAAFDELKEVVSLFIVPPESLKGLIERGHLANIDRLELHAYIKQRNDYAIHGLRAGWVRQLFGADDLPDEAPSRPTQSRQGAAAATGRDHA